MHPIPLIRASALRPLFDFAKRAGVETPGALARVESAFGEPRSLVPLALGGWLWEDVARAFGDEALGLRVGEQARLADVGEPGWLLPGSHSVGATLEAAVHVGRRFDSGHRYWLGRGGEATWFRWSVSPALRRGRQQLNDFTLMLTLRTIQLGAGAAWRPSEIHFEGPAPRHAEQLAALAEERVHFGASSTTLVFPRSVLASPMPPTPRPLASQAGSRSPLPAFDFERSVRQTVASLLRLGNARLPVAAEMAGISVRSLQRRLHSSQLDFGRLVEEARLASARRMLGEPGLKIVEVAAELGYTDSANFTRAFRRWTGVAPRDFRRARAAP